MSEDNFLVNLGAPIPEKKTLLVFTDIDDYHYHSDSYSDYSPNGSNGGGGGAVFTIPPAYGDKAYNTKPPRTKSPAEG